MLTAFVVVLSLLGLYISLYFTLLTYNVIPPAARLVLAVCRLDDSACTYVVHTPQARMIAGVPNSLLGVAYYVAIAVAAATDTLWQPASLLTLSIIGTVTVIIGMYLTHQLLAVMRVRCVLCMTAHGINAVLLLVFAGAAMLSR